MAPSIGPPTPFSGRPTFLISKSPLRLVVSTNGSVSSGLLICLRFPFFAHLLFIGENFVLLLIFPFLPESDSKGSFYILTSGCGSRKANNAHHLPSPRYHFFLLIVLEFVKYSLLSCITMCSGGYFVKGAEPLFVPSSKMVPWYAFFECRRLE